MKKLTFLEVKQCAMKSLKWTALREIASHFIQPIVTLVLAQLFTPADFGVVGVVMITTALAHINNVFPYVDHHIIPEYLIRRLSNHILWKD